MPSLTPELSLPEAVGLTPAPAPAPRLPIWQSAAQGWTRLPTGLKISLVLIGGLLILVAWGPLIAPYDPVKIQMPHALDGPSAEHWFGADHLGRDVLSRTIFGARISVLVGLIAVLPAAVVGIALGVIAGYFGGWIDEGLMRVTDVFLAFPLLILAMGISVALGRGLPNAVLAMIVTVWPTYARLARSQALSLRSRDYIEAARSVGMGPGRIILRHVVPNCLDSVLVQASMDVGSVIIIVASLSFLGMGAQPPTPEWGAMILEGRLHLREAWWLSTFPGVAMVITVTTFTLLGDGLRDWLDRAVRMVNAE